MSSETILIIICMLLFSLLLGLVIGILIVYLRDGFSGKEEARGAPAYRGSPTSYGRSWHLEIQNTTTGQLVIKDFVGQVILGRSTPGEELFWQMKVGDDPSISREQCVIYDRGGVLFVENLSQVNTTMLNGYPVTQAMMLQQGSQIVAGRSILYVSGLQRLQ